MAPTATNHEWTKRQYKYFEGMTDRFNFIYKRWRTTPFRKQMDMMLETGLGSSLTTTQSDGDEHAVDNAICIGLGRVTDDNGEVNDCSMLQLIVFLDVIDFLEQNSSAATKMRKIAQDPLFDDFDVKFLALLEIEVVPCPTAADFITPKSFLFAPFVVWAPLLASVLPNKDPLLYIGNDITIHAKRASRKKDLRAWCLAAEYIGEEGVAIANDRKAIQKVAKAFVRNRTGKPMALPTTKADEEKEIEIDNLNGLWYFFRNENGNNCEKMKI